MKKFINEVAKYIKFKIRQFIETRFFLFVLGCIIGSTTIYIYLVGRPYYNWVKQGLEYTTIEIVRASEEVSPQVGEVVEQSTGSLANNSMEQNSNSKEIKDLVARYFQAEAKTALAIAMCESSLDPSRIGDTNMEKYSYGLFQVNRTWHDYTPEQLLDPEFNCKVAKQIRDKWGNWNAWSCYKNGNYKKFLIN